ncbi:MAG: hypothetical protein JNK72_02655 [Myxococcales bacterium]|nr:hypothetical protein [Myxococcales bacterium]
MTRRQRALGLALALSLGCTLDDAETSPCAAGELRVCRTATDCRCASPCTPGAACALSTRLAAVCAPLTDNESLGACVEYAWITGRSDGRLPCGAEVCEAGASCVNWGADGIRCGAACERNADCGSGCCVEVGNASGQTLRRVCAPSANYRCETGSPAGRSCEPACDAASVCMSVAGAPRCLARCELGGAACASGCCLASPDRVAVCAPSTLCATDGGAGPSAACTNFDACVTVTSALRGGYCASLDSIEVRVRNDCARPVDVEICYEARDGRCVCGLHRNVAPGAEPETPFWACGLTGRYRLSARAAGDAPGCHPSRCQ